MILLTSGTFHRQRRGGRLCTVLVVCVLLSREFERRTDIFLLLETEALVYPDARELETHPMNEACEAAVNSAARASRIAC